MRQNMSDQFKNQVKNQATGVFKGFLLAGLAAIAVTGFFSCQKTEGPQFLKIGLPEEPQSLNVWLGTDANSRKILTLIYQPLYNRHPETLEIIPWLAKEAPVFDKDALTYTVKLRETKWSDGTDFTSEATTGTVINGFMSWLLQSFGQKVSTVFSLPMGRQ